MEVNWEGAGQKPGIEIWRVENKRTESNTPDFGINVWPKEMYGEFFEGTLLMNHYPYYASCFLLIHL